MVTVLIVIDNSARELFGGALLAHYLESAGIKPVLCNTVTFSEYYDRHLPDAVVWPNAQWDLSWVAERSLVFVLPSESGNGQPEWIAMHAGLPGAPVYTKGVTGFFCWGPAMRDILLGSGVWSSEQLLVTGSPSTDHWLLPRSRATADRRVGVTTTFRAISSSVPLAKWNAFEWLDVAEQNGGEGQFYFPPDHAESWMFVEASIARVMLSLVRTLAVTGSERVEIRPHPWELAIRYKYFERLPGGRISVRKRETISEWFERIFILFTFMSASSLDALVRGLPVISIQGLMDPDARRKMPRTLRYEYEDYLWPLTEMGQAMELVALAAEGRLAPCRDEPALSRFLADNFAYPRPRPAAAAVADHIVGALKEQAPGREGRSRRRPSRGGRLLSSGVIRNVPFAAPAVAVARYFQSQMPGQDDLDVFYWPWRLRERHAAQRAVEAVVAADRRRA